MAFTADFKINKASSNSIKVTDNSIWDSHTANEFSARVIVITDYHGKTPVGIEASIDFPLDAGFGDELTIELPADLAMNITLNYTAIIPDSSDTYSKSYKSDFSGHAQAVYFSRVSKSEVLSGVSQNTLSKYREVSGVLSGLIDGASYYAQLGDLEQSQTFLDKATLIDIDTIKYDV